MKSHLRRRLTGPALLLLVPLLAACGGFGAATDQVYQSSAGAINRSSPVNVLNALVVSGTDGTGTFAGTLVNTNQSQPDQLISITDATLSGPIEIGPAQAVNLADSGQVQITDPSIKPGGYIELTLQFASGQTTQIDAPVMPHTGDYAEVPVGPTGKSPSSTPSS